jgi:hypothetical protein
VDLTAGTILSKNPVSAHFRDSDQICPYSTIGALAHSALCLLRSCISSQLFLHELASIGSGPCRYNQPRHCPSVEPKLPELASCSTWRLFHAISFYAERQLLGIALDDSIEPQVEAKARQPFTLTPAALLQVPLNTVQTSWKTRCVMGSTKNQKLAEVSI